MSVKKGVLLNSFNCYSDLAHCYLICVSYFKARAKSKPMGEVDGGQLVNVTCPVCTSQVK